MYREKSYKKSVPIPPVSITTIQNEEKHQPISNQKNIIVTTEADISIKLLFLGDTGTGKTAFIHSLYESEEYQQIVPSYKPTIALDFFSLFLEDKFYISETNKRENVSLKLQFWDTSGQERYNAISRIYYKQCAVIILMFDVSRMDSLKYIHTFLQDIQRTMSLHNIHLVILGSKSDLIEEYGRIPHETIQEEIQGYHADYYEVSAKSIQQSKSVLHEILQQCINKRQFIHQGIQYGKKERNSLDPHFSLYDENDKDDVDEKPSITRELSSKLKRTFSFSQSQPTPPIQREISQTQPIERKSKKWNCFSRKSSSTKS